MDELLRDLLALRAGYNAMSTALDGVFTLAKMEGRVPKGQIERVYGEREAYVAVCNAMSTVQAPENVEEAIRDVLSTLWDRSNENNMIIRQAQINPRITAQNSVYRLVRADLELLLLIYRYSVE